VAVYERTYRSYSGRLTPERWRFLVLPRYAYEEVFRSKLFIAFLVACGIYPLGLAVLIYLPHNLKFLQTINAESGVITEFFGDFAGRFFFGWYMVPYAFVALVVTFIVGPALISADLRNNALPLYLARPFSRAEYIVGKSAVLIILLSLVTWVPGMLLFFFQASMAGLGWLQEHWKVGLAILLGSWIQVLVLCLISLALSAYVKLKPLARLALVVVFFVAKAFSLILTAILSLGGAKAAAGWASMLSIGDMLGLVWSGMFGVARPVDLPVWAGWVSLLCWCGFCLWLLNRKLQAYEVVT
jgi:ABC-2 type transport system permease protein